MLNASQSSTAAVGPRGKEQNVEHRAARDKLRPFEGRRREVIFFLPRFARLLISKPQICTIFLPAEL